MSERISDADPDTNPDTDPQDRQDEPDNDVRALLALAAPRSAPPAATEARVRAAVMAAYEDLPAPASRQPRARVWALAATLLAACIATFAFLTSPGDNEVAGEILFASGGYSMRGDAGHSATAITPGSIVRTADQTRMLIALDEGATVRMDHNTSATIHSSSEVWLHSGRIYVDSKASSVNVVTPFAWVTDVGTQFEVAVKDAALTVVVREGQVDVGLGNDVLRSQAVAGSGELLTIEGLDLRSREDISAIDPRWDWTQQARPRFKLEGHSVADYLRWAARETGRELRFHSELVRQQADMRGALLGLGEVDADSASIEQTLRTTRFDVDTSGHGTLVVRFRAM